MAKLSSGRVTAVVICSFLPCLTCFPLQRTRSRARAVPVRTATSGIPTRRSATSFSTVWTARRTFCPAHPDLYTTTAVVRAPGRRRAGGRTVSTAREVYAVRGTNSFTTQTSCVLTAESTVISYQFRNNPDWNTILIETRQKENFVEHA